MRSLPEVVTWPRTHQAIDAALKNFLDGLQLLGLHLGDVTGWLDQQVSWLPPRKSRPRESGKERSTSRLPMASARISANQPCGRVIAAPLLNGLDDLMRLDDRQVFNLPL